MIAKLKKMTHQLARSKPGRRFLDHYHRNQRHEISTWQSWLIVTLGVLMVVAGLLLSLPPGLPGFLLWLPGLALLVSQFKALAIALDRLECAIRNFYHKITGRRPP